MDATLADLEEMFRNLGPAAFRARWTHPVLVRQDSSGADEDAGFETGFMPRDTVDFDGPPPVSDAGAPGRVFAIFKPADRPFQERVGVGRARNTDVCIRLPRISKYHGYFTRSEDGGVHYFTDAGSKNGTTVDGDRLGPREPHELRPGSSVHLGPYHFVFYTAEALAELVGRRVDAH